MKNEIDATSRRLAVVIKDSNDAITVLDLQGNILSWNRGAEKMYGYSEADALKMTIFQIIPTDKKSEATERLARVASGECIESFETQRVTKDGKILDVLLVLTCLKDDLGVIDSVATTERDITGIKNELRKTSEDIKKLKGILSICAFCKKIRDDKGIWQQIEVYIHDHSEADFSHAYCPECLEKNYPEYSDHKDNGSNS